MINNFSLIFVIFLASLLAFGCQSAQETKTETKTIAPTPTVVSLTPTQTMAEVPKLVNKSAAELDKTFGPPEKITPATIARETPGEYRLYKLTGHPKGLSVRFYKDKAVRFNLLLGTPEKSSREALLKFFGIDVSKMSTVRSESLSETWKGVSNGVNFATAYAKREKAGGDFVMIHAEIAQ
jgi:hypothetical protein